MVQFEDSSIPNVTGKIVLITGGNTGLGYIAALSLLSHDASVYIFCRNAEKSQLAIASLSKAISNPNTQKLGFVQCDLSAMASVRKAATEILQRVKRIDILMCNAGIMDFSNDGVTADGYEKHMATNHLGHALLVKLLTPMLEESARGGEGDVRIVVLTSATVNFFAPKEGIIFENLKTEQKELSVEQRYAQSKLANILYVKELAKRYPKLLCLAIHPGLVETGISYGGCQGSWGDYLWTMFFNSVAKFCWKVCGAGMKSPEEGAWNQIWGCVGNREEMKSGEYYEPVGVEGKGVALTRDAGLGERLWEWTEGQLKLSAE
ncbi:oxidoreductase [Amylocarpus encephaloides]|uniref:Oxidoreductase n=1 Tax=Amylocarpus encephaloides TaxID=45428 RepID=A0A9P7Y899_9HELO|nr:oxidoreductase [Amylocarpus encephaloides]